MIDDLELDKMVIRKRALPLTKRESIAIEKMNLLFKMYEIPATIGFLEVEPFRFPAKPFYIYLAGRSSRHFKAIEYAERYGHSLIREVTFG